MGWDTSRFPEDPDPELICCICQGVLEDAVVSPCEHVFCSICVKEWLKESETCPNCRRKINEKDLRQVIPLVKNLISRLKIFCDYKEKGCQEITTIDRLHQHLRRCIFAPSKQLQEPRKGKSFVKTVFSSFKKTMKSSSKTNHCMFFDSYKPLTLVPVSQLILFMFNLVKTLLVFCWVIAILLSVFDLLLTCFWTLFVGSRYFAKYLAENYSVITLINCSNVSWSFNPPQLDN